MSDLSFETAESQASYGIGLQMGQQLNDAGLVDLEPKALLAGICDALEGKSPAIEIEKIHQALRSVYERTDDVRKEKAKAFTKAGEDFLQANAKREEVKQTESGLQYEVLVTGDGVIPDRQDNVRVHYTGQLISGEVFDSSVQRGQPAEFPVTGVIAGWIEALTLMPVGSKWKLYIPHQLAYGESGAGGAIPPFSALIFEVELLDII